VREAENGRAAVAILKSGEAIDIVLSDIVMAGGLSGYELGRWVQANRPSIPVLLTTGYAAEEARPDAADFPILRKPYKRAELANALRDALAARAV
jgi:CheY-like chemotaxis protein